MDEIYQNRAIMDMILHACSFLLLFLFVFLVLSLFCGVVGVL